jgi:polar amino acid transport system substrate-binding protein
MSRRPAIPLAAAVAGLLLAACGQGGGSGTSSAAPSPTSSPTTSSAAPTTSSPVPDECAKENLPTITPGVLTVGTDTPAYPPYFVDDDPSNGKGFESALTYAIAEGLGFTAAEVQWVVVPFNKSYAPGPKDFDFDINQISITPERAEAVTFSEGYYTVNQAVIALQDSPIANATTLTELKTAKLGAQVGTTSLQYIEEYIQPEQQPYVYNDTNDAKSALRNGQIDGIVVDLPTAFYITAVEIPKGKIVGQFPPVAGGEQFGLVFAKDNPLVTCVNKVLTALRDSGGLMAIQDTWMAGPDAPYFKE